MAKRDKKAEDGGGDDWLVSYADMMTLIACFFILMMAFANYDPVGFDKKANEFSKAFNEGKYKPAEHKLETLTEEIAKHPDLKKKTKITLKDSEIIISISSTILFGESSVELNKKTLASLDTLIDIIRTKDPNFKIVIEGHTDSFEHKETETFKNSWELGALRASKVLARFEYLGFNPQKLAAITKGDSQPLAPNINDKGEPIVENLQMNRRVLIKVIEPKVKTQKVKFGFGIYFND